MAAQTCTLFDQVQVRRPVQQLICFHCLLSSLSRPVFAELCLTASQSGEEAFVEQLESRSTPAKLQQKWQPQVPVLKWVVAWRVTSQQS